MKYDDAMDGLLKLGVNLLSKEEMRKRQDTDILFGPYGCLNCGKAHSGSDFKEVFYFTVDNELVRHWLLENTGEVVLVGGYSCIARCRFCGEFELFKDF